MKSTLNKIFMLCRKAMMVDELQAQTQLVNMITFIEDRAMVR
jgi:hypothetical protein